MASATSEETVNDLPGCEVSEESGVLVWEEMGATFLFCFSLFLLITGLRSVEH